MSILKKALGSVLGRWVIGGLVATLLGTAAIMWHNHKEGLKEEGRQECVQEINQSTIDSLEDALADSKSANAELRASLAAAAAVNQDAIKRRHQAEARVRTLESQRKQQRETDEEYREWADGSLPSGVADRLRQAAGSPASDTN